MLIVMSYSASQAEIDKVVEAVHDMGYRAEPIPGGERTAIGVLGNRGYVDDLIIRDLSGVQEVIHVSKPYKLVSRDFQGNRASSIVDGLSTVVIGGNLVRIVAWYDNETGYSQRVVYLVEYVAGQELREEQSAVYCRVAI